ncbi:MAG TPA: hypothetical protein VGM88_19150 [Kofleriaceae bacterium]|jgi:hypothetical protein
MRSVLFVLLLAACTSETPTPTGAVCPSPDPMTLTYDNFGMAFMTKYCISCHDSELDYMERNGAPLYHDYDSLLGVMETAMHVDEYSASGPKSDNHEMPPDRCPSVPGGPLNIDCPQPTEEERTNLGVWLICEEARPHNF